MKCPTKTIKHDYSNSTEYNASQQLDVYVNYIQEAHRERDRERGERDKDRDSDSDRDSDTFA